MVEDSFTKLERTTGFTNAQNNVLKAMSKKDKAINEFGFEKTTSVKSLKEWWDILDKVYKGDNIVK